VPRRRGALVIERPAGRGEQAQNGAEGWKLGPVGVPSPRKTAYYLGLGALAALEVVEWPVAAAIAAGTWVAQHSRPQDPAAGTGTWDLLRLPGHREHSHDGHSHDGHSHNGHAGHAAGHAVTGLLAGAEAHNGHGHRRSSTGT